MSPLKKAPGAGEQTGRKLITSAVCRGLALIQAPFGDIFWVIEQRKARIQDRLDNIEARDP